MVPVSVIGGGPGAYTAALALLRSGVCVRLDTHDDGAEAGPPLVLGQTTVALLLNLSDGANIFSDSHQLRRRAVCWGAGEPRLIDQPAISLRGWKLRRALREVVLRRINRCREDAQASEWTIFASPDDVTLGGSRNEFGRRVTLLSEVEVCRSSIDSATYWVESHPKGWVFFGPITADRAVLQATVATSPDDPEAMLDDMLQRTRYIRQLAGNRVLPVSVIPSAPSLRVPCGNPGRLAVGKAAMSLDPLCGDGTGQAKRTGLLAAGVITSIGEGGPRDSMVQHFNHRLLRTFNEHLRACATFYRAEVFGETWRKEIRTIRGAARSAEQGTTDSLSYHFRDLRLVPTE